MTPEQLEARIAALEQHQGAQSAHWSRCSLVAWVATIVFALLTMASAIASAIERHTDPITPVFGCMMTVALFLSLAFARAAAGNARPRP